MNFKSFISMYQQPSCAQNTKYCIIEVNILRNLLGLNREFQHAKMKEETFMQIQEPRLSV